MLVRQSIASNPFWCSESVLVGASKGTNAAPDRPSWQTVALASWWRRLYVAKLQLVTCKNSFVDLNSGGPHQGGDEISIFKICSEEFWASVNERVQAVLEMRKERERNGVGISDSSALLRASLKQRAK